jgi:hypothetical protein
LLQQEVQKWQKASQDAPTELDAVKRQLEQCRQGFQQ